MTETLVLHTHPMSRGRIVRWMLEEIGCPYRAQPMHYGEAMKSPAYLAINPMGKVPALQHGDTIVTEVAAICAYLADAFPEAELAPPLPERAAYYRWMFFAAGPFEAAVVNQVLGVQPPPERRGMVGYGSLAQVLDTVEAALEGRDVIASDRFSAADVVLASQIGFGMMFGTVDKRPAFVRYAGALAERPAAVRARAADDALMPDYPARRSPEPGTPA